MSRTVRTLTAGLLACALGATGLPGTARSTAVAEVAAPLPVTVTADALPTVQIDGVVWKTAIVGRTVYAAGSFRRARPAGAPPGTAEQVRDNLLSFDLVTGELLPWAPSLDAQALTVRASPDGSTVYVGGDFSTVDGQVRSRIAAFRTSDGALDPAFAPAVSGQVRALAVTAGTVYAGGDFSRAGGSARTRLAAFSRGSGALLPWQPTADGQVEALAVAPASPDRVVVGGRFSHLSGASRVGVGAVDATTGASATWASRPVPTGDAAGNRSWVTDLYVSGDTVYGAANGQGTHWFDGRFAARVATGELVWLDNCYGATYGIYVSGDVVHSVGHAHDCASLGAFRETLPMSWHRSLAETTYAVGTDAGPPGSAANYSAQPVPALLPWTPTVSPGSYTGQFQASWTVTGNGEYLVQGGEFPSVNGVPQQGLVRFAVAGTAPGRVGPVRSPDLVPTVLATAPGTLRVAWPSTWDPDDAVLTYELFRDDETTPLGSWTRAATTWSAWSPSTPAGPGSTFLDTGLADGSSHGYRIRVSDPGGNAVESGRSTPVTVSGRLPGAYVQGVLADAPTSYWRLGEADGPALDLAGNADLSRTGTAPTDGAVPGGSSTFSGTAAGAAVTRSPQAPLGTAATVEAWVRTTSSSGGGIAGFTGGTTGPSSRVGPQLYVDRSGRAVLGVFDGTVRTVPSAARVDDGAWHHLAGTLDQATGLTLYVDGLRQGRTAVPGTVPSFGGYWRVGSASLAGWPGAPLSSTLAGDLDEVAVYPVALPSTRIVQHWVDSGRVRPVPPVPTDPYGAAVLADRPTAYWRLGEPSGTVAGDSGLEQTVADYAGVVTLRTSGGVRGTLDTSTRFDGVTAGVASRLAAPAPASYSLELWMNSTTSRGGGLLGWGSGRTGTSAKADRLLYLQDDGRVVFGTYRDGYRRLVSPAAYRDGRWHHVVATQSAGGSTLYVDGVRVASNPYALAQQFPGYWRVGGDRSWGSTSNRFAGRLDEVAVYPVALSPDRVRVHWQTGVTGVSTP